MRLTPQDLGIAISAIGTLTLVVIQVIRFRIERRHLIARLSVGEPNWEVPTTTRVSAAVFNRGRPAFIDGMYWHVGPDKWSIGSEAKEGKRLPVDLATGMSYRIGFDLSRFEEVLEQTSAAFGFPIRYTNDDLLKMRLRVTDGEGHDHWADLTKDSLPNVREVLCRRKTAQAEREANVAPDPT